jgi:hypothetical protein
MTEAGNRFKKPLLTAVAAALLALGVCACGGSNGTPTTAGGETSDPLEYDNPSLPLGTYHLQVDRKAIVERPVTSEKTTSGEHLLPITPKAVIGYVDQAIPQGKRITVSGWAAPPDLSRPADAVVVFVDTKTIGAVKPTGERPDVAEGYNRPGLKRSGFAITIPLQSLDCSASDQGLNVFAIVGKTASPVDWLANTRQIVAEQC